mgnify:CR=1 FL=1
MEPHEARKLSNLEILYQAIDLEQALQRLNAEAKSVPQNWFACFRGLLGAVMMRLGLAKGEGEIAHRN